MEEIAVPRPVSIINSHVSNIEVGKYYLKNEFSNLFPEKENRGLIDRRLDALEDKELWRLLEAMSFTFRLNGIFWYLSQECNDWSLERFNISDLTLTGINPKVNEVAKRFENNPLRFGQYLRENHDDEIGDEFKTDIETNYKKIIVKEDGGKILMLDGSHRLISAARDGDMEVEAYIARNNGRDERRMIGDSSFWLLKHLLRVAGDEQRVHILETVKLLANMSLDGREAIQSYWIDHVEDEKLKEIGEKLLKELDDYPPVPTR